MTAWDWSTARRVAVGYEVGDLNRPEPKAVGDPVGRLSVRTPAKAGRRGATEVCPRARRTKLAWFGEWGVAAPRPFPDRRHHFQASGAVKAEERSVP
jgi:hypothetical protein